MIEKEKTESIREDGNPKAYLQPAGLYSNRKIFLITTHVELSADLQKRCIMFTVESMRKEKRPCPEYQTNKSGD